ncbi:MAG: class I SAM-dependent rRNA methyltransferase [Deltaproteobacteria bacterium]|nr:class I SAM-dependent rRNA methyltransferase [Deltaproteobacteria bacterium]
MALRAGRRDGSGDAWTASAGAAVAARRGHPWIYREQLRGPFERHAPGEIVRVRDPEGAPLGSAVLDPRSPIAARLWTRGDERLDVGCMRDRIAQALARRDALIDAETTAFRCVHGEGDRAPGVVVDRYGDVAVLRLDGEGIAAWAERLADPLFEVLRARGVRSLVLRSTEKGAAQKIATLRGQPPPDRLTVAEHGVPFVVDLAHGQKTGAFLDQRENRRRVGALARGRRVLNLFSYAGGFSLHAARGGATRCTSVDVAAGAHATAQASFRAAGIDPDGHDFVTADVFGYLERAAARGERWDLVISDPPNMAPSAATRGRALTAYRKLHALCVKVLSPGGLFCAASCSSHVSLDDFFGTLADDALGRSDLRILEVAGAGPDHPVLAAFPEGRYLEFCVVG